LNNDNVCSDNEPYAKTDINGKYSLNISNLTSEQLDTAKLIIIGGIDKDSGKPFIGIMKSPLQDNNGEINITPLTTIVASKIAKNIEAKNAFKEVADTLGLTTDDIRSNPLIQQNKKIYEKSLKIQKSVEMLASVLGEDNKRSHMDKILKKVASKFNGLSNKNIQDIIQDTNFDNDLDKLNNIKVSVKDVISTIIVNDNANSDEMAKVGAKSDEKRDLIIDKVKGALNNNDFNTGFDSNTINNGYD